MDTENDQSTSNAPVRQEPTLPGELLPPMISYTSNMEDVLLRRCFRDLPVGNYIDIGAHHPTSASVTRWLYDQGWSGVNVEPGDGIQALRSERPRDINLQIAVTDQSGEATFWVHSANPGTSTLATDVPDSVLGLAGKVKPIKVVTETLATIFDRHFPDQLVNFVKIDAEGAEDPIIRSTDWRKYRPELLVIESTEPYSTVRRAESWPEHLRECGYDLVYFDGINDFWLRDESMHRAAAFKVPVNVLDNFTFYDPEKASLRQALESRQTSLAGIVGPGSETRALLRRTGIVAALRRLFGGDR